MAAIASLEDLKSAQREVQSFFADMNHGHARPDMSGVTFYLRGLKGEGYLIRKG